MKGFPADFLGFVAGARYKRLAQDVLRVGYGVW
jgi:hypothetical protein